LDPMNSQECVGRKGYVGSRMKNGPHNKVAGKQMMQRNKVTLARTWAQVAAE